MPCPAIARTCIFSQKVLNWYRMKQNDKKVTEMEPENSIPCFLARSAAYLEVPAGEGMDCTAAAARANEETEG